MSVSLQGFNSQTATFKIHSSGVNVGAPVTLAGNYLVKNSASSGSFIGVCTAVNGDYASIALVGEVKLAYSGTTTPSVGKTSLVADGSDGVKVASSGDSYIVVSVDTVNETISIIL